MALVAVAPHRGFRGFDGIRERVAEAYQVLDLHDALTREYRTDAHLVTYVVPGARRQPRVNKPGLPFFPRRLEVGVFFCDVDNPGHSRWTDELFAEALEQYETLGALQTAGVYHTEHGRRIVQPIAEPIPVQEVEPYIRRWFRRLEEDGLAVDWQCRDWTRHYRLPHVWRGGARYRSPWVDLRRMRPIELEPLPPSVAGATPATAPRASAAPRLVPDVDWTVELPPAWEERVRIIAAAVREVQTEWHTLFLALAGALLSRGAPPEHVPVLCRAVSLATGADTRTDDRETGARTTVRRWLAGQPATGYTQLALRWPGVALALDEAMATGVEARMRAQAAAPGPELPASLEETTAALEDVIRRAPPGLTLISSECGLGKTAAAMKVAAERAARPYASPEAQGVRAPPQSKTSISVDKNALAIQIQEDLELRGVAVRRIFGPLSVLREDGTPECRYHETAQHLVAGGQAIKREFCEGRGLQRCEHYDECAARRGSEGPGDARVVVGPHALIGPLDKAAGTTGLLVIDEPPHLLDTTPVTLGDLERTERALSAFDRAYADAMRPALQAARAWILAAEIPGASLPVKDGLRRFGAAVDPEVLEDARVAAEVDGDCVACAAAAPLPDPRSSAPPLRIVEVSLARHDLRRAQELGVASRVLGALHHAARAVWLVAGRVEQVAGQRLLLITSARRELTQALRREGAVVLMDANVGLDAAIYETVVGYAPPLHDFRAGDGAPIARTVIRCRSASRTHWMRGGKLRAEPSLVGAVRALIAWAQEDRAATSLGIITLKPIRLALEAALRPEDPAAREAWRAAGQEPRILDELVARLGPVLAGWGGEIILGHYGAVRGLNNMAGVDCLATLADPWPNLDAVRRDAAYVGREDGWRERVEGLCRAELEQAHGRLRTVHRTRPGRALHVGRVLPGGSGWSGGRVEIRHMQVGRPQASGRMTTAELEALIARCGSLSAAARLAGCSRAYLLKCRTGERPVSDRVAEALRALERGAGDPPQGCTQNP